MRIENNLVLFYDGVFSNFFECDVPIYGYTFPTSEHAFMYKKAMTFGDDYIANQILQSTDTFHAKMLGRRIKNYSDVVWDKARYKIMLDVNMAKYSISPILEEYILDHGCQGKFVEASGDDRIWGIGLWEEDDRCLDESKWLGQNLLGKVLDDVYAKLNFNLPS